MSKTPITRSSRIVEPIASAGADARGTVISWPDIRRPTNVDPFGEQPTVLHSDSENRVRPMPVSRAKRASTELSTTTGTVRKWRRYRNGVDDIAAEPGIALGAGRTRSTNE
jgi:hypothetical protein